MLGVALAVIFAQSKWIETSLFPYAVILQVTPIVAIAPLIIIWVDDVKLSLLICAWIVAFFPILSNTTLGLNSADHNLIDLFQLYRASRWQTLRYLRLPAALPYFLGGLQISGGLVADRRGGRGVRRRHRRQRVGPRLPHPRSPATSCSIPRMFAALLLISVSGILLFLALSLLSHLCLRRWHESALKQEN